MRYDRDNEGFRRGPQDDNRRSTERYHQFGAEEDRSIRDSARDYGRYRNRSIERFGPGNRYFGDFSSSRYDEYDGRGRYEPEHRSTWESVKDFFGVGPKGYSRSDDRIHEDVSDALTRDRAVDASEIEVSVMSGMVTLRGSVSDKWMKRRAEDCAEEISGVKDVRNELEVRLESGGALSSGTGTGSGVSKNPDRSSERSDKRKLS